MLKRVTERWWFRWTSVSLFLVSIFALPLVFPQPPQEQTYEPEYVTPEVEPPVSPDERLADYTEALAAFTALLAFVSATQVWLLIRAENNSKRVFELSEKQLQLDGRQVELAEKQFLMEGRQADLAEKQHGLARLQHITANRPQLRIRSISITREDPPGPIGPMFKSGQFLTGNLVVANIGGTDAIIKESRYRFYWSNLGLPMQPPLEDNVTKPMHDPEDQTIEGFESCLYQVESSEPLPDHVQGTLRAGGIYLYLMGIIRYSDINQKERFMGFCRQYIPPESAGGEGRFSPVSNPDYEFQD